MESNSRGASGPALSFVPHVRPGGLASLAMCVAMLPGVALAQVEGEDEGAAEGAEELSPAEQAVIEEDGWLGPWFEGWEGSVAAGLNGSTGNNERINLRAEIEATRTTDFTDTKSLLSYSYGKEEGDTTENRFFGSTRTDWTKYSPWRPFVQGSFDFDEFQAWDVRLTAYGGIGYEFIKDDDTELIGRIGAGVNAELGAEEGDVYAIEGLLGVDFTEQISERQKLTFSAEFLPRLDGPIGPYRVNARATWELMVDPETDLALKVGVEDRYQSSPGAGFKRNDLDYFVLVSWSF